MRDSKPRSRQSAKFAVLSAGLMGAVFGLLVGLALVAVLGRLLAPADDEMSLGWWLGALGIVVVTATLGAVWMARPIARHLTRR